MGSKKTAIFLSALIFALVVSLPSAFAFSGTGSGTIEDPYIITDVDQLQEIDNNLDAWYELGNDIDASETSSWNDGKGFDPIGESSNFKACFDGKGHVITGLYINRPTESHVALFRMQPTIIKNVGLKDAEVHGLDAVGVLSGWGGDVTNSYATGTVSGNYNVGGLAGGNFGTIYNSYADVVVNGDIAVGGLVGSNNNGEIISSHATGTVNGREYVGGLVGVNYKNIIDSYATSDVTGTENHVGGLAGSNRDYITISYASGTVIGNDEVGGLVGSNDPFATGIAEIVNAYATGSVLGNDKIGGLVGSNKNVVTNSYSTGEVTAGTSNVGGLVGYNDLGVCTANFWDTDTSGVTDPDSCATGKNTIEMQTKSTFSDVGWNLDGPWVINEAPNPPSYPYFAPVVLHLTEMPTYTKEDLDLTAGEFYSSGATVAEMILDYVREAAGVEGVTQTQVYNHVGGNGVDDLNPDQMDEILGHFDPYDEIITTPYNYYDLYPDGNPYQGYNYTVDTYDDFTEYIREIAHWMDYEVTQEAWWLTPRHLVAEPNTPAALPVCGEYLGYNRWVAVNGFAASGDPAPYPDSDPWYTPEVTIYGFWLTDPNVGPAAAIVRHVYVIAADSKIYLQPINIPGDPYHGKYVQVAEPPPLPLEGNFVPGKRFDAKIAQPKADFGNLEFIGIEAEIQTMETTTTSGMRAMSVSTTGPWDTTVVKKKTSWKDLVDFHLLFDPDAIEAFEEAEMAKSILVDNLAGSDYYLVPFTKDNLATGVIMLDAEDGHFRQATWTSEPAKYLQVTERKAINLTKKAIRETGTKNIKPGQAETSLEWQAGDYSQSPFQPYWTVTLNKQDWIVTRLATLQQILFYRFSQRN